MKVLRKKMTDCSGIERVPKRKVIGFCRLSMPMTKMAGVSGV